MHGYQPNSYGLKGPNKPSSLKNVATAKDEYMVGILFFCAASHQLEH